MPTPSDDEVDYLLSRGSLGRRQKERILEGALGSTPRASGARRTRWWVWGGGSGLVLAVAAALVLWVHASGDGTGDFRAKGSSRAAPVIDMACLGASLGACPHGSRVAFSLDGGGGEAGFVTAYGDPASPGERVWYLDNEPVGARAASAGGLPRLVPNAAIVGAEHPAGLYRVTVVVSRRPLARAELARIAPTELVARAQLELVVTP